MFDLALGYCGVSTMTREESISRVDRDLVIIQGIAQQIIDDHDNSRTIFAGARAGKIVRAIQNLRAELQLLASGEESQVDSNAHLGAKERA